jgi:outer membrane biosynthesis protein TonB
MRPMSRITLLACLLALASVLTACESFDPESLTDKLDVFGLANKKKLPGERKPLFPEGVPGVTQGIPPEYMKGAQQPQPAEPSLTLPPATASDNGSQTVAAAPAEETKPPPPKPKAASKPKPKAKTASAPPPPTQKPAARQEQTTDWPAPQQQQQQAPWPDTNQ